MILVFSHVPCGLISRRLSDYFQNALDRRYGAESADDALLIMQSLDIQPLVFDREQMTEARAAWRRFGKGRHPAALNLGDCCAYAAALTRAEPLLYKGQDFSKTDITAAEW